MASVLNPRAPVDVNGNRSTPAITARTPHEMAVAAVWLDGRGYHREALMLRGRLAAAGRCVYCGGRLAGERSKRIGAGKQCAARFGL
jgi:hypothetical protein